MAQRRMFNKSITNSSKFLKMPMTSRLLYYDLGMNADDDGFVEHFMVLRMTGATQQDLGVLEINGLVKVFDENVLWIKDWKENNYIQKDRYQPSKYLQMYNIEDYIEYEEKQTIPLTKAQQKRLEAKKESDLPSTFENTIRNAFIGKECPVCKKIMNFEREIDMPSIQHNIPISLGGKHEIDNISVICRSCNCSIQNKQITKPYNTEEVKKIWECIGNVSTGKDRLELGKDSIDKINSNTTTIYEYVEQNFGRPLSPAEVDKIESWLLSYDPNIIKYAVEVATLNNKRTFNYVNGILKNWKSCNYQTLEEIKENEIKKKDEKPMTEEEKETMEFINNYDWLEDEGE